MKIDYSECLHFDTAFLKFGYMPLIENTIADVCKNETRVLTLWPAGSVVDRGCETHTQRVTRDNILQNFVNDMSGGDDCLPIRFEIIQVVSR